MKKREYSPEAYKVWAQAMNVDFATVDFDLVLAMHRSLVSGADRLLEIGLREVEPAFAAMPGKEWR